MAKRRRMSREELDAFLDEVEARREELRRLIEEREAARNARDERRLRRRRLLGLLPRS